MIKGDTDKMSKNPNHNNHSMLAVGDRANRITIRDLDLGKIVATFKHTNGLNALAWSYDGQFLASGDMAKKVTIRDVYNGQTVSVYTHQDKIMSVSFLPMDENGQGHVLAASDKSGMIAIRSMTRGQVVSRYVANPKVEM